MSGTWREQAVLIATLITIAGMVLMFYGGGPVVMFVGGLSLAGLIVERSYRAPADRPPVGPNWRATDERFTDPESGKRTRVWYDSSTGQRHYVAEDSDRR